METVETINLVDEYNKLKTENERLRDVLQSISNNTCCDNCQEAALVARAALKERVMDDTEKLSQMMIRCGLATGHGDTVDDLIFELEKQIKNTSHAFSDARKQNEQLRLANSCLQMHYDYAKTEHDKLKAEVKRLRGSLAFISILQPFNGQSWQSHAKFITAYAIDELTEKTLYDEGPRLDDRGDNLDGN